MRYSELTTLQNDVEQYTLETMLVEYADDILESAEHDPFGLNVVTEIKNANLNSLTAKDLQDPEKISMVKAKLSSIDTVDGAMTIYKKINKLMTLGGAVATGVAAKTDGFMEDGTKITAVLTLGNIVLGSINKLAKKAVDKKEFNELKKIDSLLTTSIADMKKSLSNAPEQQKQKIQASIDKAEQLKAYVKSKQETMFNRNV